MKRICCAALGVLVVACTDLDKAPDCTSNGGCEDTFPGLTSEVLLSRDDMGVVHIYAQTDPDAYFASGYAQARDRLFQMDLRRRQALGRQSEVLGEGSVQDDELIRIVGIPQAGADNAARLRAEHPDEYALLVAWVAGINRYIGEVQSGKVELPYGFGPSELDYSPEEWSPADALAVGKLILFGNANQIEFEIVATILRDYFPDVYATIPVFAPLVDAFVLPEEERPASGAETKSAPISSSKRPKLPADAAEKVRAFVQRMASVRPAASNNWALDGRLTASGRPMIAGDPHQGLNSPSLMWAHHINSADAAGTIDVVGFSFVGSPGVQLGHNRDIAWTATTNYPDTMDLWDIVISNGMASVGGTDVPVVVRMEEIPVRGQEARTLEVIEVPGYGVILPDTLAPVPLTDVGHQLLFRWTGLTPTQEAHAFLGMSKAVDRDAFDAAVDGMEIGNFNFIAADKDGITYRSSPVVPDRGIPAANTEPFAVLDGTDPSTFWTGEVLSPQQMPHSRGGTRGWVASANNDPLGFTQDGSLVGDPYYFGVVFDPGTRASRIHSEIARMVEAGPATLDDMKALQTDTYSVIAELLMPLLGKAIDDLNDAPALEEYRGRDDLIALAEQIQAWDRKMERESSAAVSFHAFMHFLGRRTVRDDFPLIFDAIADANTIYGLKIALMTLLDRYPGASTFLSEGSSVVVMEALDDTHNFLVERFGSADPDAYRWSDYHVTRFRGLWGDLDGGSVPTDGADGTVNVSSAKFFSENEPVEMLESTGGAIYRLVATFSSEGIPEAEVNFPRGNSGDPTSPFYNDQTDSWVEDRYAKLRFSRSEIDDSSVETVSLKP